MANDKAAEGLASLMAREKELLNPTFKDTGREANFSDRISSMFAAPARNAISEGLDKKSLKEAAKAFVAQYGKDPELAPSGPDVAKKLGISGKQFEIDVGPTMAKLIDVPQGTHETGISPESLAGTVIEQGLDPSNYISPGKLLPGVAGTIVKKKASLKAGELITEQGLPAGQKIIQKISNAADTKVGKLGLAEKQRTEEALIKAKSLGRIGKDAEILNSPNNVIPIRNAAAKERAVVSEIKDALSRNFGPQLAAAKTQMEVDSIRRRMDAFRNQYLLSRGFKK